MPFPHPHLSLAALTFAAGFASALVTGGFDAEIILGAPVLVVGSITQSITVVDNNLGSEWQGTFAGIDACPTPCHVILGNIQGPQTGDLDLLITGPADSVDGCSEVDFEGQFGLNVVECCRFPCEASSI